MKTFVTKEEYDELKQRISKRLERLESRIAAIEKHCGDEPTKESLDVRITRMTLMNGTGDSFELEGTEKQLEAFEAERKERNDALFPSCMSFIKTVTLALEHGLSVKKVTTRK